MLKNYSKSQAKKHLPSRKLKDNKTRGGKVLIVAGSEGMWGAAVLSAVAAARAGAGYVYLLSEKQKSFPLKDQPDFLILKSLQKAKMLNHKALAIGPGLSQKNVVARLIKWALKRPDIPVVLDAEALNVLATMKTIKKLPASWILTPHEGELARLLQVSSSEIKKHRSDSIKKAQKKYGCVILLKGHETLIADGRSVLKVKSGNPALAKAGTGDVLTGMIVAFLAQGLPSTFAAALGAYIHGQMADEWIKKNDVLSLMASDLIEKLPQTLKKIRES